MGKIVVSENVTLDGVVQDPTGEEDFRPGGWFVEFGAQDFADGPRSSSTRRGAPGPSSWAGGAMSGSARGGHRGPASGRTG